jgi:hypothetical protein
VEIASATSRGKKKDRLAAVSPKSYQYRLSGSECGNLPPPAPRKQPDYAEAASKERKGGWQGRRTEWIRRPRFATKHCPIRQDQFIEYRGRTEVHKR